MDKATGNLSRSASRAGRAAGVALGAGVAIGAVAIGRGVKSGIESLALLEDAQTQVTGAIDQVGLGWKTNAAEIATWANQIEADTDAAFDDKDIVSATATLIRFGKVSEKNLQPAMEVMTDLAARTGDVGSASELLAKALADPAKAAGKLARFGVVLTKTQQDQIKAADKAGDSYKAQRILLDALADTTRGAAAASAGPYRDSLNILTDVTEDAQRALGVGFLPVITKVRDILTRELAKPGTLKSIEGFGRGLASGLEKLIDVALGLPWDQIKTTFQIMGTGGKAVLDAFLAMPPWVQTAVLTAWGTNKITGGLIGELGKGLIKGVLGMNAGVVNINAGVVTGAGGPGGGTPPVAPGGGGKFGFVGNALKVSVVGAVAVAGLEAGTTIAGINDPRHQLKTPVNKFGGTTFRGTNDPSEQIGHLERSIPNLEARIASGDSMASRQLERVIAAINGLKGAMRTTTVVTISASDSIASQVRRRRIVKPGGPRRSGPLE